MATKKKEKAEKLPAFKGGKLFITEVTFVKTWTKKVPVFAKNAAAALKAIGEDDDAVHDALDLDGDEAKMKVTAVSKEVTKVAQLEKADTDLADNAYGALDGETGVTLVWNYFEKTKREAPIVDIEAILQATGVLPMPEKIEEEDDGSAETVSPPAATGTDG